MVTVAVTGGAGFIGSHVAGLLSKNGNRVVVLDDLSTGKRENLPCGVEFHQVDIRSQQACGLIRDTKPDVVVHLAAQISVTESMRNPVKDADINVCGALNLLSALDGSRLPYFVFISTGGAIYGEQETYPAPETHANRPTSVYGVSKRAVELFLDLWARQFGLRHAALRLANVYGPRQDPHGEAGVVAIFAKALLEGKSPVIFGSGEQTRDFVYVEDVAAAVNAAVEQKTVGTYNIGTGRETTVNELFVGMREVFGLKIEATYKPARVGDQFRSVIDPRLAGEKLGWKPRFALTDGLVRTCRWFEGVSS